MRRVLSFLLWGLLTHLSVAQGVVSPLETEETYEEDPAWEYDLSLTPPANYFLFASFIKDAQL